jgi:hypothetical protein
VENELPQNYHADDDDDDDDGDECWIKDIKKSFMKCA